jgi:hypothetical protein
VDAAGDEQSAERTLDGVTQPVHQGTCVALADAEHFGQLEPVQLVTVGEVEDGLVTLGQSTGRHRDQVGELTSGGQGFGSGFCRF